MIVADQAIGASVSFFMSRKEMETLSKRRRKWMASRKDELPVAFETKREIMRWFLGRSLRPPQIGSGYKPKGLIEAARRVRVELQIKKGGYQLPEGGLVI
jgi:hypothetical protein